WSPWWPPGAARSSADPRRPSASRRCPPAPRSARGPGARASPSVAAIRRPAPASSHGYVYTPFLRRIVESRKMLRRLLGILMLLLPASASAQPVSVLRMSTAAPDGTGWARELKAMGDSVQAATHGALRFKWYFGGVTGDEL